MSLLFLAYLLAHIIIICLIKINCKFLISQSADSRLAVSVAAAAAALGMQPIGAQQTAEEYLKRMTDQVCCCY